MPIRKPSKPSKKEKKAYSWKRVHQFAKQCNVTKKYALYLPLITGWADISSYRYDTLEQVVTVANAEYAKGLKNKTMTKPVIGPRSSYRPKFASVEEAILAKIKQMQEKQKRKEK